MSASQLIILMADNAPPAPPPVPTFPISDTFNRANSNNALGATDTHQTWIAARGTWGITDAVAGTVGAYLPVNDVSGWNVAVVESGVANGAVECQIVNPEGTSDGVTFRYVDAENWLAVGMVWANGTQALNLYKRIAGVTTTALLVNTTSGSTGGVLRVELSGTSLVVKIGGVQRATATVTEFTTATKHGLFTNTSYAGSYVIWDNFAVQ